MTERDRRNVDPAGKPVQCTWEESMGLGRPHYGTARKGYNTQAGRLASGELTEETGTPTLNWPTHRSRRR